MNLSKEKRNHLILAVLGIGILVGVWYGVIYKAQVQHLADMRTARDAAEQKLKDVRHAIDTADQIQTQLCEYRKRLEGVEETMASGDLYSWAVNTLRQFKLGYKVEIPQYSQIDGPRDVPVLAGFPYKQATMTIGGSARFYDLGRFIADFENHFPYFRIMNLSLEPASGIGPDKERLAFKMEIAALVKPGVS